ALERNDRVQRVDRPLARRDGIGRARIEREAGEAVIEQDPYAWHDGRRTERAEDALDQRDRVAVAIDDREVSRIRRRHERSGFAALAGLGAYGAAPGRDELGVEQTAGVEVDAGRIAGVCVALRERELL